MSFINHSPYAYSSFHAISVTTLYFFPYKVNILTEIVLVYPLRMSLLHLHNKTDIKVLWEPIIWTDFSYNSLLCIWWWISSLSKHRHVVFICFFWIDLINIDLFTHDLFAEFVTYVVKRYPFNKLFRLLSMKLSI